MAQVSVIIPLYNKAGYIARALDSVLAQTYGDFEVIVVDDGSTDNSADIVAGYADARIRLIRQANTGPGRARNRGIDESTGTLLAFLDADDEWLGEFLERSVDALSNHPDCALSVSGYLQGPHRFSTEALWRRRGVTDGPWRLPTDLSARAMEQVRSLLNSWAIVARRPVVEQYGGFYAKGRCTYGEDTYLWLQILLNHTICITVEPLVWYHSEASDLAIGRSSVAPLEPVLTDSQLIGKNCPSVYRAQLKRWLALRALLAARHHARAGEYSAARRIVMDFPDARALGWEYVKTSIEMLCMPVFRLVDGCPVLVKMIRRIRGFGWV